MQERSTELSKLPTSLTMQSSELLHSAAPEHRPSTLAPEGLKGLNLPESRHSSQTPSIRSRDRWVTPFKN